MVILSVPNKCILLVLLGLLQSSQVLLTTRVSPKSALTKIFALGVSLAKGWRRHRRSRKHHHLTLPVHLGAGALLEASEAGALVHHPLLPAVTLASRNVNETILLLTLCGLLQPWHLMCQHKSIICFMNCISINLWKCMTASLNFSKP